MNKEKGGAGIIVIVVSIVIPLLVAILYFAKGLIKTSGTWVYALPHINVFINGSTAILLLFGRHKIKHGDRKSHKKIMITSFVLGVVFLLCYVTYHATVPSTHYGGEGFLKYLYFSFLITHILTAAAVVPFVLLALYFALQNNFKKHRRVVKYGFPLWLYVSITGVIVYLMIRPYY